MLSPALYEASVRPRINASHAVHVQLDIQVVYILGLVSLNFSCDVIFFSKPSIILQHWEGMGDYSPQFQFAPDVSVKTDIEQCLNFLSHKVIKLVMKCFMYLWIIQSQMTNRL